MDHPHPCIVVLSAGSEEEARLLATSLVEERLVACCTRIPGATSWYMWQGRMEEAQECILLCKTFSDRVVELQRRVVELHSHEVPEIITVPASHVSASYLAWMRNTLGADQ